MYKKPKRFDMDAALEAQLVEILHREGKSFTDFVHDAAREYIQHHGGGNPAAPLDKWVTDPEYLACPTILEADKYKGWDKWPLKKLGEAQLKAAKTLEQIKQARAKKKLKEEKK